MSAIFAEAQAFEAPRLGLSGTLEPIPAMSLVGRQFGSFPIPAPLGKGGMGEVYLARDRALDRNVAIKTIPAELQRSPDRLARFRREARMLAALNHPNIAAIYGFEEFDAQRLLVMELIDGETLAERVEHAALPLDEALSAARQIVDALEAAHAKRVVHRDLKPANIKVTPEGRVKVLDFGLAKSQAATGTATQATVSGVDTAPGLAIGTPPYMSPNRFAGRRRITAPTSGRSAACCTSF